MNPSDIAVTTLLLGQSAFYASGHSNSFASFDLTNGFNGIKSSRAVAVALQALLSNFFGPVWWSLASLRMLLACLEGQNVVSAAQSKKGAVGTRHGANGMTNENGTSYANDDSQWDTRSQSGKIGNIMDSRTDEGIMHDLVNSTGSLAHPRRSFFEHLTLQTFYTASTSLAVTLACIWRRNDPTIWTVLTPKCLNILLWTHFQQVLINFVLCTGIWVFVVG